MKIVYKKLNNLLPGKISFVNETKGSKLENKIKKLKYGKAILIQNTRYEDIYEKKESNCDEELAKYWASLADIFINDAFATIHRKHASNYGISCYLPSAMGFLIEDEINNLSILDKPKKPFVIIMGGSKISDKIGIIQSLITKADYILVGGAMAHTFIKANGYEIGLSIYEKEKVSYCKEMLKKYKDKIFLPIDLRGISDDLNHDPIIEKTSQIEEGYIGLDIGDNTIENFKDVLKSAETVFWNGPLGKYEDENYIYGTKEILEYLKRENKTVILGGGDIVACANVLGYTKDFIISTGGGATLKYLENHNQPGLENLK